VDRCNNGLPHCRARCLVSFWRRWTNASTNRASRRSHPLPSYTVLWPILRGPEHDQRGRPQQRGSTTSSTGMSSQRRRGPSAGSSSPPLSSRSPSHRATPSRELLCCGRGSLRACMARGIRCGVDDAAETLLAQLSIARYYYSVPRWITPLMGRVVWVRKETWESVKGLFKCHGLCCLPRSPHHRNKRNKLSALHLSFVR
jgi:hypothetical protein